ncbi:hypothetical protein ACVWYT_002311 [Streptomyces sp. TE4109]
MSASRAEAAGAWSQESMEGLRAEAARSAAAARARGGVWRWAAQRGSAGSAAPSVRAVIRVRRASWGPVPWSGTTGWVAVRIRGVTASGPPAGRGPSRRWAPSWSAVRTVSMRGRRAAGPVVVPARGGVGMAWALRMRGRAWVDIPACPGFRWRRRGAGGCELERRMGAGVWGVAGSSGGMGVARDTGVPGVPCGGGAGHGWCGCGSVTLRLGGSVGQWALRTSRARRRSSIWSVSLRCRAGMRARSSRACSPRWRFSASTAYAGKA